MSRSWSRLLAGVAMAVQPGVLGVLAPFGMVGTKRIRLPRAWLLGVGGVLWLLPVAADVGVGSWTSSSTRDAGLLLVFLASAVGGAVLGRDGALRWLPTGLTLGLCAMAVVSLVERGLREGRVEGWASHPNVWGASTLLPLAAVLLLSSSRRLRLVAAALALVSVALSGSRSAALIALVIIVAFMVRACFARPVTWRRRATQGLAVIAGALVLYVAMALVQPRLSTSLGDLFRLGGAGSKEVPLLGAAQPLGVEVARQEDGTMTIRRVDGPSWSRLQYPLILFPDTSYAIAMDVLPSGEGGSPGILGARGEDGLRVSLEAGAWVATASGRIDVLAFSARDLGDGWTELAVAFTSVAEVPLRFWIGPAPDLGSDGEDALVSVRRVRAAIGGLDALPPGPVPPPAQSSLAALARLPAFDVAWAGFLERPLFGQRRTSFASYYRDHPPSQDTTVAGHAHDFFLQSLFERGAVGTLGCALLLVWVLVAPRDARQHVVLAVLLATALVANVVDTVLWSAGMGYFLAVVAGAAGVRSVNDEAGTSGGASQPREAR